MSDTPLTRLLVTCADRPGIVAAVSSFLRAADANIVDSHQHSSDPQDGTFSMRMVFAARRSAELRERFAQTVAEPFAMDWQMWDAERPKRVAVLVSRQEHCLLDLLWRGRRAELGAEIDLVISNHDDLRADVGAFGVRYAHVPVDRLDRAPAEARLLELLRGRFDLVVLARYMQILSGGFLEQLETPVINIHHSFLPAFAGAAPYQRAKARGVKLIGATAHYVTEELDGGPIIEQDVVRVSHADSAEVLERRGADIERVVLARAVRAHCEDRVVARGGTTIVF